MKCNSIFVSVGARDAGVRENENAKCVVFFQNVGLNLHIFVELAWISLNPNEWSDIKNLFGRRQLSSIYEQQKSPNLLCVLMFSDYSVIWNVYGFHFNESISYHLKWICPKIIRFWLQTPSLCIVEPVNLLETKFIFPCRHTVHTAVEKASKFEMYTNKNMHRFIEPTQMTASVLILFLSAAIYFCCGKTLAAAQSHKNPEIKYQDDGKIVSTRIFT